MDSRVEKWYSLRSYVVDPLNICNQSSSKNNKNNKYYSVKKLANQELIKEN